LPRPAALAAAVLLPLLVGTAVATALSERSLDDRARDRVRAGAEDAVRAIDRRVRAYTETLYGVRSLFTASDRVTRAAFHDYVASLELAYRYPGIQVIGVAEPVPGPARGRFVARVRADARASGLPYPRFRIRPAGRRPRYVVIDYLEPQRGNEAAFGLDFLTEENRRATLERATVTGAPSATAPIRLVQEVGSQRGFLFQLAFYDRGAPLRTRAERRAALRGVVSAAFRMGDLMQGVLGPQARGYDVEVYDAGMAAAPAAMERIYDLDGRPSDPARIDPERESMATLTVGGRRWRVLYALEASPLSATERRVPLAIALGGALVSVLLTWIVHALATRRVVAERTAAAKAAFLATLSHELRNPLVGVTGMLDVLARTDLDPGQRHMVGVSQGSAESILRVIGDLLDMSRMEAGKLALEPRAASLRRLAGAVVAEFRTAALSRGIALGLEIEPGVAAAHVCDPVRLRQILTNLVSNALRFTPSGSVDVSVRVLEDAGERQRLALAVADTGIGVSKADQRRLFQPFEQVAFGARGQERGTGLGLAISRQLASLMDGELTMRSEVGSGTTVRLELTLAVADPAEIDPTPDRPLAPPAARRLPTREEAEREGSLVLLVEDHDVARTVLARQLETIGFRVDAVSDGAEAFVRFRRSAYGIVLTDLSLPHVSGLELAAAIRRAERESGRPSTPVLALAAGAAEQRDRWRAAGIDDVVAKPVATAFLAAKLREWLPHVAWTEVFETNGAPAGAIDAAVLAELTGGDSGLAAAVLEDFLAGSRRDLAALRDALAADQPDGVRLHAHRLNGAACVVGAHEVVALAQEIEDGVVEGADGIAARADRLEAALERVAAARTAG
jgi:signal transduction histidine kinase/CheY-like chemotaxis protein/HPt (histidine-containing phosphotransfer) domain-containing protein